MHVYHYAAYEKTALRKLSVLHVAGEDIVDEWLREGLLVDLYQTVRNSIRISENSYSIKKLEPLYMGTNLRSGDVKDAGASVVAYAHYCDARDDGRAEEAASILAGISDYNEYDCLSTLELRNWLLGLARERGIKPGGDRCRVRGTSTSTSTAVSTQGADGGADSVPGAADLDPLEVALAGLAGAGVGLSEDDRKAVSMLAAAVSYHRRERKAFWWAHFDRCENGPDTHHQQDRNVFLVEDAEVLEDWWKDGAKLPERRVKLIGTVSPGSDLREGSTWFRMYEPPLPAGLEGTGDQRNRTQRLVRHRGPGTGPRGRQGHRRHPGQAPQEHRRRIVQVPVALTEDQPIRPRASRTRWRPWPTRRRRGLQRRGLRFPRHPALDLVRRVPPRLASGAPLPAPGARAGPVHRRDHGGGAGPGPLLPGGPGSARDRQDPCGIACHRPAGGPRVEGRCRRAVPCGGGEPAEDRRDQGRRRSGPRSPRK